MSVGFIGSYLFLSVVSLSCLDEGRSFVSRKCWIPLGLVNITVSVCNLGELLTLSGITCWPRSTA